MPRKSPSECHRYVDMWALPGVHPSNLELLQKLKTADTQHFNTHMDIVGTVSELEKESGKWEKSHIVGLRNDVWRADKEELEAALDSLKGKRRDEVRRSIKRSGRLNAQQSERLENELEDDAVMRLDSGEIETRRLVMKLFKTTGDRVRWSGTIEQVTATEVHNSLGSRCTLLTLVVMLPRQDFVVYIQQNHRTFRIPSVFSFGFYDDRRMWNLLIKRRWLSMGADFDLEVDGDWLGEIDGKLISFGGDSYIDIENHELASNTPFMDLITLFTASVSYHKAMRKSVSKRVKAARRGESHCHVIDSEELRLRNNGRAAA